MHLKRLGAIPAGIDYKITIHSPGVVAPACADLLNLDLLYSNPCWDFLISLWESLLLKFWPFFEIVLEKKDKAHQNERITKAKLNTLR